MRIQVIRTIQNWFLKCFKRNHNDEFADIKLSDRPQCSLQQSTAQCEEPTSAGCVDRKNLPGHQNPAPKEIYDERKNNVGAVQQQHITLEDIINDLLQRIFLITVNFGKIKHVAKNFQNQSCFCSVFSGIC